jgi:type I restriction enzyme, S subunit
VLDKVQKPGWRQVKFGDVVRLSKARCADPLAEGFERFVGLEHLKPGDLRIRRWGNVADGTTFTNVFQPGQVLFGKRRAYQRKVAVAEFAGVCSGDIYVLESKNAGALLPELLPFICQTEAFFEHAVGTSAGSLSPRTNWTSLADFVFALPPTVEQRAIVTLLRAIENVCNEYIGALTAADDLFESSLWDCTTGRYASKKKKIEAGEWIKGRPPGISQIPLSWKIVRLTDVAKLESGHTPSRRHADYWSGDIPWISLGDTERLDTRRIFETGETVSQKGIDNSSARLLPKDTVVLCRTASVGFCSVMEKEMSTSQDFANFVCDSSEILPDFLYFLFRSLRSYWKKIAMGGGVRTVYMPFFKEMQIALPPIEDQKTIISNLSSIQDTLSDLRSRLNGCQRFLSHARDQAMAGGGQA